MIRVENTFAKHGVFWSFTLPFVGILIMPMFFGAEKFAMRPDEIALFRDVLGIDVNKVTVSANSMFSSLFVETGVYKYVNDFFHTGMFGTPKPAEALANRTNRGYSAALWAMAYQGVWRITALWPVVLSYLVAISIPAIIDGLATRAKKGYTFENHNPVYFWTASHSFIMVLGLGLFLPLTPIMMTPMLIATLACAMFATAWITASNFQTGN